MTTFVFSGIMCIGLIIFARKRKSSQSSRNTAGRIEYDIQQARDKVFFRGGPSLGFPYQG
jgi:hypothetical protein